MCVTMGEMLEEAMERDPKRFAFTFARYKFVGKMLAGNDSVLEIGADSGFMARVVEQFVGSVTRTDLKDGMDFTQKHMDKEFEAAYALDVLEHVHPAREDAFMRNVCASLDPYGTFIVGMPSRESQPYASMLSRQGHVNCKSEEELRELMARYFRCVYLFGMNDETLHTGFGPMCHYRIAVCNTKKEVPMA